MTNVQPQNKSSFLDLLQEQIFQRFRFGKQTKLDHSEELIGETNVKEIFLKTPEKSKSIV